MAVAAGFVVAETLTAPRVATGPPPPAKADAAPTQVAKASAFGSAAIGAFLFDMLKQFASRLLTTALQEHAQAQSPKPVASPEHNGGATQGRGDFNPAGG